MTREIDLGVLGAIIAMIGGTILLVHWGDNSVEPGLIVGAVLVVGGLLLRLENAIRDTGSGGEAPPPAGS